MHILLTTTSFQDTPGSHHDLLAQTGWKITRARGPLPESEMLKLAGDFDAFLCGDDAITPAVLDKALPRLKVISKYGIGVDKIDVAAATARQLPVLFCPGVNHTTVAEHTFALLLALVKNLVPSVNASAAGQWKRQTGREILNKTIGIVGLGRIGKETAIRARAFGMKVLAFDKYFDEAFAKAHEITRVDGLATIFRECDIISLHTNLTDETRHMVNATTIRTMKSGAILLNCARGELVDSEALADALNSGYLGGYGADVLDEEPPSPTHPLLKAKNCIVTPHVGSRTHESVQRQATMAVQNLINAMKGEAPLAQVNPEVKVKRYV